MAGYGNVEGLRWKELNIQLVKYFELVITERRAFYRNPERQVSDGRDIVDVLLSLEEEEQLPAEAIMGVLFGKQCSQCLQTQTY